MALANIRNVMKRDIVPGALLRMSFKADIGAYLEGKGIEQAEPVAAGWSDCLVASVDGDEVVLLRPRATFENGKAVVRSEEFRCTVKNLVGRAAWQLVLNSRGEAENYFR